MDTRQTKNSLLQYKNIIRQVGKVERSGNQFVISALESVKHPGDFNI